jgi:hypothetical protein
MNAAMIQAAIRQGLMVCESPFSAFPILTIAVSLFAVIVLLPWFCFHGFASMVLLPWVRDVANLLVVAGRGMSII